MEDFRPVAGQVALIEGLTNGPVTGVVVNGEPLTLDIAGIVMRPTSNVEVTIWGGGDRWLTRGSAWSVDAGRVVIEHVESIERRDRRAFARREVRLGMTVCAGDDHDAAHCIDLSAGGMRVETAHLLPPGSKPTVILPLPDGAQVMAVAEVLDAVANGGGWMCRMAFRGLRATDEQRLMAVVASPLVTDDRPRPSRR